MVPAVMSITIPRRPTPSRRRPGRPADRPARRVPRCPVHGTQQAHWSYRPYRCGGPQADRCHRPLGPTGPPGVSFDGRLDRRGRSADRADRHRPMTHSADGADRANGTGGSNRARRTHRSRGPTGPPDRSSKGDVLVPRADGGRRGRPGPVESPDRPNRATGPTGPTGPTGRPCHRNSGRLGPLGLRLRDIAANAWYRSASRSRRLDLVMSAERPVSRVSALHDRAATSGWSSSAASTPPHRSSTRSASAHRLRRRHSRHRHALARGPSARRPRQPAPVARFPVTIARAHPTPPRRCCVASAGISSARTCCFSTPTWCCRSVKSFAVPAHRRRVPVVQRPGTSCIQRAPRRGSLDARFGRPHPRILSTPAGRRGNAPGPSRSTIGTTAASSPTSSSVTCACSPPS